MIFLCIFLSKICTQASKKCWLKPIVINNTFLFVLLKNKTIYHHVQKTIQAETAVLQWKHICYISMQNMEYIACDTLASYSKIITTQRSNVNDSKFIYSLCLSLSHTPTYSSVSVFPQIYTQIFFIKCRKIAYKNIFNPHFTKKIVLTQKCSVWQSKHCVYVATCGLSHAKKNRIKHL